MIRDSAAIAILALAISELSKFWHRHDALCVGVLRGEVLHMGEGQLRNAESVH